MKLGEQREDECFILVKAQPHRSSKYYETVCCAGIGRDGKWRRQYPVPFRILESPQKFKRWSWIRYSYTTSKKDPRSESQKVLQESIEVEGELAKKDRARILNPLIRESFAEAESRGESLTMMRPKEISFEYRLLTDAELHEATVKHADLAKQLSLFDAPAKPLTPCPYEFKAHWVDQSNKRREHICDDWESVGAFFNFRSRYGEEEGLKILKNKYETEYFNLGLALAFSTHSKRNVHFGATNQWLLVGLIRLDEDKQTDLFLSP